MRTFPLIVALAVLAAIATPQAASAKEPPPRICAQASGGAGYKSQPDAEESVTNWLMEGMAGLTASFVPNDAQRAGYCGRNNVIRWRCRGQAPDGPGLKTSVLGSNFQAAFFCGGQGAISGITPRARQERQRLAGIRRWFRRNLMLFLPLEATIDAVHPWATSGEATANRAYVTFGCRGDRFGSLLRVERVLAQVYSVYYRPCDPNQKPLRLFFKRHGQLFIPPPLRYVQPDPPESVGMADPPESGGKG